jgi:hypothetical protein
MPKSSNRPDHIKKGVKHKMTGPQKAELELLGVEGNVNREPDRTIALPQEHEYYNVITLDIKQLKYDEFGLYECTIVPRGRERYRA